jgi:uncharacterized RDD family membrane protein YckC
VSLAPLAIGIAAAAAAGALATGPAIPAVGAGEHVWFVMEGAPRGAMPASDGRLMLWHHPMDAGGPYATPLMPLPAQAEALAAWGDRIHLVFAPRGPGADREVLALAVVRHPVSGTWFPVPLDRLEVEPSLPPWGRAVACAGTAEGPVALLVDERRAALLRLEAGGWSPIPLPDAAAEVAGASHGAVHLAAAGAAGERLVLCVGDDPSTARLFVRDAGEGERGRASASWREPGVTDSMPPGSGLDGRPPPGGRRRGLVRLGPRIAAIIERDGRIELAYERLPGLLPFASFRAPEGPMGVAGTEGAVVVISGADPATATLLTIDAIGRESGPAAPIARPPRALVDMLRLPILLAIALTAVLLAVSLRPERARAVALREGLEALPAPLRLAAVAIDFLPGAIAAMAVLDCRPHEMLAPPLFAPDLRESGPYALAATITALLGAAGEVASARTIGKAIVGARVAGTDGERPSARRLIARNLVKAVVLIMPPLAVVVLVTPHRQGLPDFAARTVVVRSAHSPRA